MNEVIRYGSALIVIILLLINALKNNSNKLQLSMKTKTPFLIILLIGCAVRLYRIAEVPYGMNIDEAAILYDAYSMVHYGVDRWLVSYPVYLENFGGGQNVLLLYFTMFFIKVIGYSIYCVRLPLAISGVLSIVVAYFLGKELKNDKFGLIFSLVIAISPYFIMQSRWGLESNLFPNFFLFSFYFFIKAIKSSKNIYYLFTGIFFGITLYTYATSYIFLPLFLLASLLFLVSFKKIKMKSIIVMAIPLFVLAFPLILFVIINYFNLDTIKLFQLITIPRLDGFRGGDISLANILNNFRLLWIMLTNDSLAYNSIPGFGTFYYFSIPLFGWGLFLLVKHITFARKSHIFTEDYLIFITLVCAIFLGLIVESPSINRINVIFPALAYIITLGVINLIECRKKTGLVCLCLASVNFISFEKYYFNQYYNDYYPMHYFDDSIVGAVENYDQGQNIYIQNNESTSYIYLLAKQQISPYQFNETRHDYAGEMGFSNYYFKYPETVDSEGIYIIYEDEEIEKQLISCGFSWDFYKKVKVYFKL